MWKTGEEREDEISVEEATRRMMMIDKHTTRTKERPRDLPGVRQVADGEGLKLCDS